MTSTIKYILLGIIFLVMQILITEFINIWPFIMLTVAPILIISLPISINPTVLMLTAAGYGLLIDIFTEGLLGINASALLTLAVLRKPTMQLLVQKNYLDNSYYIMSRDISFPRLLSINMILCSIFLIIYFTLDSIGHNLLSFNLLRFAIGLVANVAFWIFLQYVLVKQILK